MAIRTAPGKPFVIEVEANPTTGYLWEADLPSGVEMVEHETTPGASRAMGAAGSDTFTLRATEPGEYVVTLKLRRPWESGSIETRTFSVVATKR